MQYVDVRPVMRTGQVVGFPHEETESWHDKKIQIVKHVTQSPLAHVGIVWVVENNYGRKVFVIEAVIPEVRIFPLSKLGDFYWFPLEKELSETTELVAMNLVGMSYSEFEAGLGYIGRNNENNDVTQCAELVKVILRSNEIVLPGNATPAQVADNLMDLGIPQVKVCNPSQSVFI